MTRTNPDPYFAKLVRRIAPKLIFQHCGSTARELPKRPWAAAWSERVIAAGEAAGHIKTTTGGGIYYGLLSAELVADVLIRAFRNKNFSTRTLGEFERYWRSAFGNELMVGYFARKLASHFTDGQIDQLLRCGKCLEPAGSVERQVEV